MIETKDQTFIEALAEIGINHDAELLTKESQMTRTTKSIKPILMIIMVAMFLTGTVLLALQTDSGLLKELITASTIVMIMTFVRQMDLYHQD